MAREETEQVKVGVGIESLWGAMAKDLSSLLPIIMPTQVTEAVKVQGDGSFGTIYHFKFGPGVPNMSHQKEEVAVFDETLHRIGLQVIEGGRLDVGFTFYINTFQFTAVGDSETLVDLTVNYVTECQETEVPPGELLKSTVHFVRTLEAFLLKQGPSSSENE